MSWFLAKLSGKSDSLLNDNQPIPSATPALYPSIPHSDPSSLPYDLIQPTPTMPGPSIPSPHHQADVLPPSLDAMKVKFKFLYDSNMEDLELKQLERIVQKSKQSRRQVEEFISEIEEVDFELEKSVVSSS